MCSGVLYSTGYNYFSAGFQILEEEKFVINVARQRVSYIRRYKFYFSGINGKF